MKVVDGVRMIKVKVAREVQRVAFGAFDLNQQSQFPRRRIKPINFGTLPSLKAKAA
jgi:hypothetical protein